MSEEDRSVETFQDLFNEVQRLILEAVGNGVEYVRIKEDYRKPSYMLTSSKLPDVVNDHHETKKFLGEVMDAASEARRYAQNSEAIVIASEAVHRISETLHWYNEAENNSSQPIDYHQVYVNINYAQEQFFDAWTAEFLYSPHFLYEFTVWLNTSFFYLNVTNEFKKSREFKELNRGFLPALQRRLRNQDGGQWTLPDEVLPTLANAVQTLEWVDVQAQLHGSDSGRRDMFMSRLESAYTDLQSIVDDEVRAFTQYWTDIVLYEMLPNLVRHFDLPGYIKIRADALLTILRRIDDFLTSHPTFVEELNAIVGRVAESIDGLLEAKEILESIWAKLSEGSDIAESWERLKALYKEIRDRVAREYWAFYNDYDDLRIGARAIVEIRDLMVAQVQREETTQAEVQAIIDQHKQAAQEYLAQNADLFEPPPIEAVPSPSPFVSLPEGFIRKDHDSGAVVLFLPDGTMLRASSDLSSESPMFSAVLPDSDVVEVLPVQPSNTVRLSDGREFEVAVPVATNTDDEVFSVEPPQGEVRIQGSCRELLLDDGAAVRYYPKPDTVTATLADGTQASISLVSVWGLGTSGRFTESETTRGTLRSYRFDNGIAGTVDRANGFTIALPGNRTVTIRRALPELNGENDAPMTQSFTCKRGVS